jgi:hypothetical protein
MNALVVPTARPERIPAFLDAWWREPFDLIVLVQDAPRRTLDLKGSGERVVTFTWEEIDRELPCPEIISRRDSAIRSFGFYQAWQLGAELICTLDDDCGPLVRSRPYLVAGHRRNLWQTPRWASTVPGLRVRGLPYHNRGAHPHMAVSMGLWAGHADVDAVTALAGGARLIPARAAWRRFRTRVMPATQYFPLCGMNLAFRREAACLMYFPPMGQGSPYGRFDDIWCGLVLQRVCRHLGYGITVGRPLVRHTRASDPFANLVKEAPGVRDHERLWEVIDAIRLSADSPLGCMTEVAQALVAEGSRSGLPFGDYLVRWGEAIGQWCRLFEEQPAGTVADATDRDARPVECREADEVGNGVPCR